MASAWYVSSVAYAAIPQFAINTAYTVGQIIRSLAAAANGSKWAYRCTTSGTSGGSESSWNAAGTPGNTTGQGTATFTTVNSSTYGWGAAAGDVASVTNQISGSGWASAGDTICVSSDHSESYGAAAYFQGIGGAWSAPVFCISVNRGGSVPPVAGDITPGAAIGSTNQVYIDPSVPVYLEGFTITAANGSFQFGDSLYKGTYLKNCAIVMSGASTGYSLTNANPAKITLDNTTIQFGNAGQGILPTYGMEIIWINTPSAIQGAAIPTNLLKQGNSGVTLTCRGIDLSAVTTTLVQAATNSGIKALFDSCKIASGVTPYGASPAGNGDVVELVNCYDGTNTRNEKYGAGGKVTTERTIVLTGGATDDIGAFSLKYVSNATGLDSWSFPLEGFWLDAEWSGTLGSARTATVEIVSSASLNNDDISLMLEYQGTSGSPVASFGWSLPATPLTAHAAVASSSAGWTSSPATPFYQHLQVTFTPQVAGRVRGLVRLGKVSTTVYINPVITIT